MLMTDILARAIASDKADDNMRNAARTKWSIEDYCIAVKEYKKLRELVGK